MDEDTKACPVCGESIRKAAIKCRFCNSDLAAFAAAKEQEIEKELFAGHPAVIYSIGQTAPFLIAIIAAVVIAFFAGSAIQVFFAFAVLVVVCAAIWLFFYMKSRGRYYVITTQRIKLERGLLSKVQENLELFRIDHFELRRPLGMRLLGQASLHLFSSDAELENFSIYGVAGLAALGDTLRDCQLRERTRRGLTTFVRA